MLLLFAGRVLSSSNSVDIICRREVIVVRKHRMIWIRIYENRGRKCSREQPIVSHRIVGDLQTFWPRRHRGEALGQSVLQANLIGFPIFPEKNDLRFNRTANQRDIFILIVDVPG